MPNTNNLPLVAQKRITVLEFIKLAFLRWYLFVIIVPVCAVLAFVYSTTLLTPMYESTAKLYIINKDSSDMQSSDLSISTWLVYDFADIIGDRIVLDEVAEEIGGKYSANALKSFISINNPENTRIIQLTVRSPKAEDSKKIVDSVCRISQEKLVDVMGLDRIKIISEGNLATGPCSPNVSRNVSLSVIFGLGLSMLVVLVLHLLDNTLTEEKDIEKYLGVTALGSIPYNNKVNKSPAKNKS